MVQVQFNGEWRVSSTNGVETIGYSYVKNNEPQLKARDLNIKCNTIKVLEKHRRNSS